MKIRIRRMRRLTTTKRMDIDGKTIALIATLMVMMKLIMMAHLPSHASLTLSLLATISSFRCLVPHAPLRTFVTFSNSHVNDTVLLQRTQNIMYRRQRKQSKTTRIYTAVRVSQRCRPPLAGPSRFREVPLTLRGGESTVATRGPTANGIIFLLGSHGCNLIKIHMPNSR